LGPRVEYRRSGLPDIGVSTRRCNGCRIWSGPQARRDHVLRLQRRLRRLEEPGIMWLRARRRVGAPQRCSRGGEGVIENFTIFEGGNRGGCQKTIPPSSLRYEDQVEVRLPLSKFRVENFEVEMQENRDRSTVCFVSKPREASSERMPTRQLDRGRRSAIRRPPHPTDRYGDGRT
jgi:hypothetical protein